LRPIHRRNVRHSIARHLMRGGELHQEKGAGELTVGIMTRN
jgi:hypothetical protein